MGVCCYKLVDIIECEMKSIKAPLPFIKSPGHDWREPCFYCPSHGGCDSLDQRWNMFLFMSPPSANFLGLQRFYFPFRSNYRLRERMKWVEMKGLLFFFTSWNFNHWGRSPRGGLTNVFNLKSGEKGRSLR